MGSLCTLRVIVGPPLGPRSNGEEESNFGGGVGGASLAIFILVYVFT